MCDNKVYACPICGGILRIVYDVGNAKTIIYNHDNWCDDCNREIVSLATPQMVEMLGK